ncbi:Peptidyl-prolyl cis-trans isomerase cyp6 [Pseudocyphellaria aurata]|nr:Peptidyl-prolyl cis-trans isomerase cyp6 [Pseudocyphellaria aurata]
MADEHSGQLAHESIPVSGSNAEHGEDADPDRSTAALDETAQEEAMEKLRREREARAQALTLEIVGDLPSAEVKPPENVLFVCKLNPVTEDEDLNLIFSRFGKILSCEVIRDKRTSDSLQYAFIEFEEQKDCEQAYFKMQGVLIDDHRIHVDFSQSVSRLSDTWRNATNSRRAKQGGGFGGVSNLEKKRQYRAAESKDEDRRRRSNGYDMIFDKDEIRHSTTAPEAEVPQDETPTTIAHHPGDSEEEEGTTVEATAEMNTKSVIGRDRML